MQPPEREGRQSENWGHLKGAVYKLLKNEQYKFLLYSLKYLIISQWKEWQPLTEVRLSVPPFYLYLREQAEFKD